MALLLLMAPARAQDLLGHGGPVRALAVLPGGVVASAGFDAAVIWWDAAAGRALRVARWHAGAVATLVALPGGGLASAGEDGRVALWPPGGSEAPARVLEGHAAPVAALAVSAEGVLASADWAGEIRVWAADGSARVLRGHAGPVTGLAWRGAVLGSVGQDGTLREWGSGAVVAEFGLPRTALVALAQGWALGGVDGEVRLGALELEAGERPVVALALSPDGAVLAAATAGGAVTLWALPSGRLLHRLEGPGLPVWSLGFAADGATLWSGGQDRRVRRWAVASGAALGPVVAEPAEAAAPEVFRACSACHALGAETAPMAGPSLAGLFGRRMGSLPGYAYSERLARGDVVWTPETVGQLFTEGPDVMLPGTRMPVQRLNDPAELAALLAFLGRATR